MNCVHAISFMKSEGSWELPGKDSKEYTGIKTSMEEKLEAKAYASIR